MPPTYKRKKQLDQRLAAVADNDLGIPKLTAKQEKFARLVAMGVNPKDAYRQSHDASQMKENSVAVEAWRMRQKPKIAQFIRAIQRLGIEHETITRESHLAELARGREIAYALGQASAGIQAEHYRGRVSGLYNDRITLAIGPSDEALLGQLAAILGPETAQVLGEAMGVTGDVIDLQPNTDTDSETLSLPPPWES